VFFFPESLVRVRLWTDAALPLCQAREEQKAQIEEMKHKTVGPGSGRGAIAITTHRPLATFVPYLASSWDVSSKGVVGVGARNLAMPSEWHECGEEREAPYDGSLVDMMITIALMELTMMWACRDTGEQKAALAGATTAGEVAQRRLDYLMAQSEMFAHFLGAQVW
jgi:hypothetical protein